MHSGGDTIHVVQMLYLTEFHYTFKIKVTVEVIFSLVAGQPPKGSVLLLELMYAFLLT